MRAPHIFYPSGILSFLRRTFKLFYEYKRNLDHLQRQMALIPNPIQHNKYI